MSLRAEYATATGPAQGRRLFLAAEQIAARLSTGAVLDAAFLRATMTAHCGGSDADGYWHWKEVYDACEAASVLFLRRFGRTMLAGRNLDSAFLAKVERLSKLIPTHTRRSEESVALQQFSTPLTIGVAAIAAARITEQDIVLEPSAGTGLLAVLALLRSRQLHLNEIAAERLALLRDLFGDTVPPTAHDAAQLDDLLDPAVSPTVVVMNPPFSALVGVQGRVHDAAFRHLRAALARLRPGGRLVAITGHGFAPDNPAWASAFETLQETASVVFSASIDGSLYARHGTTMDTRLTVIDKVPRDPSVSSPFSAGPAQNAQALLAWVEQHVPARAPCDLPIKPPARTSSPIVLKPSPAPRQHATPAVEPVGDIVDVDYDVVEWTPPQASGLSGELYEPYTLQSIKIHRGQQHPDSLVQSAAMASVAPPKPSYKPRLPAAVVDQGLLSAPQLETVIYAGEAHSSQLAGAWKVDDTYDVLTAAVDTDPSAVRLRRGYFLGDGTGTGKGRQVAGIILDNWLKGRRRAVWVSKSDKLLEDAQRDWSALGQERLYVRPLSTFRQGAPIRFDEGILFTTYATLRSEGRESKKSRIAQVVDWLGRDFDGVIVFDEAHEMQNAVAGISERGDQEASQQGRAGLRLQNALPDARVVYVSATGATTIRNLGYATRLGLWGSTDFPFATRSDFLQKIDAGGIAAMEVVARDLKALGLYVARSLSYVGVEYEMLEHSLTPPQIEIYDAYAEAFSVIHNNLAAALAASNVTGNTGTLNAQAKSAAHSAFEATKQRFFGHLITAMMTPSLIAAIDRDLIAGNAPVIQIVSTGQALMERRLAEIPSEEYGDLRIDITPREYVLDYLASSFPTQLYREQSDSDGNVISVPVFLDGHPVQCRDAARRRDALIEHLAGLPPIPGALDQLVQHFGTDQVAEVTGRSRRIVAREPKQGTRRLVLENRAASANITEAQAFMDDVKRLLIFSEAGGTGRSYHADKSARNQRRRIHYLLEPGWKADAAIQGLGRTHRTNQAQPPLFRPMAANVKAQKRFLSTIARRLDTLGALTRGQRQTGGQGLFRAEDNLEGPYAREALRALYLLIVKGKIDGCSLEAFEAATGLRLTDDNGIRDQLPPINTFLNRLLALRIDLQNILFTAFEQLLARRVEGAIAAGVYDLGLETLAAESFVVTERRVIHSHASTGATSTLVTIQERKRNRPVTTADALAYLDHPRARLLVNGKSGRAAVSTPTSPVMSDDGAILPCLRLIRPMEEHWMTVNELADTSWKPADQHQFEAAWQSEVDQIPPFRISTIYLVTGLLLPIWSKLPGEGVRVYRLQTDAGERLIGRVVSPAWAEAAAAGIAIKIDAASAFRQLLQGDITLQLSGNQVIRRTKIMGLPRIELCDWEREAKDRLIADGLFSEIIQWQLRLFIPTDDTGPAVLKRLIERYDVTAQLPAKEI